MPNIFLKAAKIISHNDTQVLTEIGKTINNTDYYFSRVDNHFSPERIDRNDSWNNQDIELFATVDSLISYGYMRDFQLKDGMQIVLDGLNSILEKKKTDFSIELNWDAYYEDENLKDLEPEQVLNQAGNFLRKFGYKVACIEIESASYVTCIITEKEFNTCKSLLDAIGVEIKQKLLVYKNAEINNGLPADTKTATTEPKEAVLFSSNRGHKISPKKRESSSLDPIMNIITIIFNPVGIAITAFLLFLIVGFYRQNAPAKLPKEKWVDLYKVTDTFTDDTFTVIREIPGDELVAIPVKVYHTMTGDGMDHYYLRNLNNKREHFHVIFPADSYKKNEVLWIFFSTKEMVAGNTLDNKTVVRDQPWVHKAEITISIDYWDIALVRISSRSGADIPISRIDKFAYKYGYTDIEWEHIYTHNIDISTLSKKARFPKALIIVGSISLFIIALIVLSKIKSKPRNP